MANKKKNFWAEAQNLEARGGINPTGRYKVGFKRRDDLPNGLVESVYIYDTFHPAFKNYLRDLKRHERNPELDKTAEDFTTVVNIDEFYTALKALISVKAFPDVVISNLFNAGGYELDQTPADDSDPGVDDMGIEDDLEDSGEEVLEKLVKVKLPSTLEQEIVGAIKKVATDTKSMKGAQIKAAESAINALNDIHARSVR